MKRYEKLTKEEIIELVVKVGKVFCDQCPIKGDCERLDRDNCSSKLVLYLQEEVITKPRFMTFKSAEEFRKAIQEIEKVIHETNVECHKRGDCKGCKYGDGDGCKQPTLEDWLCKEIEVEEQK